MAAGRSNDPERAALRRMRATLDAQAMEERAKTTPIPVPSKMYDGDDPVRAREYTAPRFIPGEPAPSRTGFTYLPYDDDDPVTIAGVTIAGHVPDPDEARRIADAMDDNDKRMLREWMVTMPPFHGGCTYTETINGRQLDSRIPAALNAIYRTYVEEGADTAKLIRTRSAIVEATNTHHMWYLLINAAKNAQPPYALTGEEAKEWVQGEIDAGLYPAPTYEQIIDMVAGPHWEGMRMTYRRQEEDTPRFSGISMFDQYGLIGLYRLLDAEERETLYSNAREQFDELYRTVRRIKDEDEARGIIRGNRHQLSTYGLSTSGLFVGMLRRNIDDPDKLRTLLAVTKAAMEQNIRDVDWRKLDSMKANEILAHQDGMPAEIVLEDIADLGPGSIADDVDVIVEKLQYAIRGVTDPQAAAAWCAIAAAALYGSANATNHRTPPQAWEELADTLHVTEYKPPEDPEERNESAKRYRDDIQNAIASPEFKEAVRHITGDGKGTAARAANTFRRMVGISTEKRNAIRLEWGTILEILNGREPVNARKLMNKYYGHRNQYHTRLSRLQDNALYRLFH